jgi:acetyl-CoA C-acetyltransferase
MNRGRRPCVIGVARRTIHPEEGDAPEPLALWEAMAREAAADSGGHDVLAAIDDVNVVYTMSWTYDDAPGRLAERLGVGPGGRRLSSLSGTSPQKMLDEAAERILAGQSDLALVTGAEVLATKKRMKKAGVRAAWSHPPAERPAMPFDDPFHPAEVAHQIFQAYLTFALFDVARRAHLGLTPEQNRDQLGELFAPMSRIAAANPHAWLRTAHDAHELVTVTPINRMVALPYPKNLVSIMDVDMAAALILASDEKADALGVPKDRRVYLRGWCQTRDPVYVAERSELWRSAGMREASRTALGMAGVGIDEVAHLDLYSCFGSSVNFARDALGIGDSDPRPLTVTGGLPFHGGPGSNYLAHSVATLVEKLREDPRALGLVSGVGMHMTNHVYAVYSAQPGPVSAPDARSAQQRTDLEARASIVARATGPARISSYSVVHDHSGPSFAVAVCDLSAGVRCYARSEDRATLAELEAGEWVGAVVDLDDAGAGVNRFTL